MPPQREVSPRSSSGTRGEGDDREREANTEEESSATEKRLYIVDFDDEAERKRVDSAMESWSGGDAGRPSGAIRVAEGEDHEELLDILTAKVPVEHIQCYEMSEVDVENPTVVRTITRTLSDSRDSVDSMINFVITSHRGNMIDPRGTLELSPEADDMEDVPLYRVSNKKGTVNVAYQITETDGGDCTVEIAIKGHHIPVAYVEEVFKEDLERFQRSREQQSDAR